MIYVYGAGKYGTYLVEKIIKEGYRDRIGGVIDRSVTKATGDIAVITPEHAFQTLARTEQIIIAMRDKFEAQKVVAKFLRSGFSELYFMMSYPKADIFDDRGGFAFPIERYDMFLPTLPYVEFQVADHCNLNCKSCSHFSNLVNTEQFASYTEFEKSIQELAKYFDDIPRIRLLGGEPLLNKELPRFVRCAREAFPYAKLCIVTNGILVPQISDEDWKIYRGNGVEFNVSLYPPSGNNTKTAYHLQKKTCSVYFRKTS